MLGGIKTRSRGWWKNTWRELKINFKNKNKDCDEPVTSQWKQM